MAGPESPAELAFRRLLKTDDQLWDLVKDLIPDEWDRLVSLRRERPFNPNELFRRVLRRPGRPDGSLGSDPIELALSHQLVDSLHSRLVRALSKVDRTVSKMPEAVADHVCEHSSYVTYWMIHTTLTLKIKHDWFEGDPFETPALMHAFAKDSCAYFRRELAAATNAALRLESKAGRALRGTVVLADEITLNFLERIGMPLADSRSLRKIRKACRENKILPRIYTGPNPEED
jgi:hypothetical protein